MYNNELKFGKFILKDEKCNDARISFKLINEINNKFVYESSCEYTSIIVKLK